MTLDQLAIKYGSDKSSLGHNYCPFYEQHLPKDPKRILEIGVKGGASIGMWLEYFPNAEIHGLDLFSEIARWEVRQNIIRINGIEIPEERMYLHKGDQRDWQILEELRKYDFDIIIDDGSHNARDQMITFFGLFNGKHYFIEDLHCNDDEFFSQGLPIDYRPSNLFNDIKTAYEGTVYRNDIIFDNEAKANSFKPDKIVCIYASQLNNPG
jgi:hypothetical protein